MLKREIFSVLAVFPLILCGCSAESGTADTEVTEIVSAAPATVSEISEAAQTTLSEPVTEETEIMVSYPCMYKCEELKCLYDDKEIYGNLYLPEDGKSTHPVVILSHGYNSAGSDMADMAKGFAENGIAAYTYDFCGGSTRSKSSGSSHDMSVGSEQRDLGQVIDMISAADFCERIYLYGESQGGFVSALTGASRPNDIAAMFLVYPAFCIPDDWLGRNGDEMTEPFDFMGMEISRAFYDGVPRYDVFEYVKAYKSPVLIFHGDKDPVVKLSYSEKLTGCFPNASLTVVEGGGHGFSGADRLTVKKAILDFIQK